MSSYKTGQNQTCLSFLNLFHVTITQKEEANLADSSDLPIGQLLLM